MTDFVCLLAQSRIEERMRALRGGFNDRPTDPADVKSLVLLILAPVALVLLLFLLRRIIVGRRNETKASARPARLFDMVLKKMGIGLSDRFLLRAFARAANRSNPTVLLLSRELFERHGRKWLGNLSIGSLQRHARARFAVIADLAFGPMQGLAMAGDTSHLQHPFNSIGAGLAASVPTHSDSPLETMAPTVDTPDAIPSDDDTSESTQ